MEPEKFQELIKDFELKNDLTDNIKIWVGHAKIGFRKRPSIDDTKRILLKYFEDFIEEYEPTPEKISKIMPQWEDSHPYQKVRELDQPMFFSIKGDSIIVAVIWPWQIKDGVASLMVYEGKIKN